MPKKKSSAKKTVQRGFATTSVIKKRDPDPQADTQARLAEKEDTTSATSKVAETPKDGPTNGTAVQDDWSDSEEAKLLEEKQVLLESVRSRSEKDASKTLKVLEYEKRIASTLPEFTWDDPDGIRDEVIQMEILEQKGIELDTYDEPEEKLLTRIAGLHIILLRLGFTNGQVEECLRTVKNLEIDDAIAWLHLRYTPHRSQCESDAALYQHYGRGQWPEAHLHIPVDTNAKANRVERTAAATKRLDTSAVASVSSALSSLSVKPEIATHSSSPLLAVKTGDSDSSDDEERKVSVETPSASSDPSTPSAFVEDMLQDDPDAAYVALKLRITSLQRHLGLVGKGGKKGAKSKVKASAAAKSKSAQETELDALQSQLKKVQQLYLFNAKKAEAAFTVERAKLDKLELSARLAGKAKERQTAQSISDGTSEPPVELLAEEVPVKPEKTIEDSDTMFGEMLEDPDHLSSSEKSLEPSLNDAENLTKVRDMSLPKNFTGKTPKALLEDALRRTDKHAKATYRLISKTRACRAVVNIRWDTGKTEQYGMEDEACENQEQAFHYVATLALFALSSEGSLHRILPAKYRDLWDELAIRKKTAEDRLYEDRMVLYRDLAQLRRSTSPISNTKAKRPVIETVTENDTQPATSGIRPTDGALQEIIAHRQGTPTYKSMLPAREALPIASYKEEILAAIERHQIVVLCGETGCGKSTQTPTMILENELAKGNHVKIFCTEPRRISAISLAQRVSQELGEPSSALGGKNSFVGYNIRLEARVCPTTRLIYATTGILLRMLENNTELEEVTHIIIDEVHERSIDSDFLLIILRALLQRRKNLHLLLMSATVDADKIAEYMGGCPVINVPGRTFPVTPYFLEDAVELSHYNLSPDSDSPYVQRLPRKNQNVMKVEELPEEDEDEEDYEHSQFRSGYSKQTLATLQTMNEHIINFDLIISLLETICFTNDALRPFSSALLIFLPSLETIRKLCDLLDAHPHFGTTLFQILPLHSSISSEQQTRVFNRPPPGVRKIVVSTNIAETGVTIPDVTAVIDSGRHKEMRFDEKRQISKLVECWIARSNALQRRGRAGRVQEGICFHLFTKARLESYLAEHPQPEMLRLSLQDLALRIKILNIFGTLSIEETLAQALDPPLAINVQRAIGSLIEVKALTTTEEITQLGRHLVKLPLDVHTAKLCLIAAMFGCLDAALTIAAALNSKSFFLTPFGREAEADTIKRSFKGPDEYSDFLVIYRAYKTWRQNCENGSWSSFCRKHFLSHQNLMQVEELKCQYLGHLQEAGFVGSDNGTVHIPGGPRLRFARISAELDRNSEDGQVIMTCIAAAMYPNLLYLTPGAVWKTLSNNAPVAIHPSSSNFVHGRRPDFGDATFLTYFNIQQSKRLYVWENGVVPERGVMLLCGDAEIKHHANTLGIDRRIKRYVDKKTGVALNLLRTHFDAILQLKLDRPSAPLPENQLSWFKLLERALVCPELQKARDASTKTEIPAMKINVVRPSTQ